MAKLSAQTRLENLIDSGLPKAAVTALGRRYQGQIMTLGELLQLTEEDVLDTHQINAGGLNNIKAFLKKYRLSLKPSPPSLEDLGAGPQLRAALRKLGVSNVDTLKGRTWSSLSRLKQERSTELYELLMRHSIRLPRS